MTVTPFEAATDVLDRADALLTLDAPPLPESVREDLRRLAWAMASASIDTFLHWRVARVDLYSEKLHKELRNLEVSFHDLVKLGREDVVARQEGRTNRPLVKVRNVLHERILKDTYQTQRGVERALNMCGVTDCWQKLSLKMGEPRAEVTAHLNSLARRRNSIVHEGDIQRQSRPRNVKHEALSNAEVRDELAWVRRFVDALRQVAA